MIRSHFKLIDLSKYLFLLGDTGRAGQFGDPYATKFGMVVAVYCS